MFRRVPVIATLVGAAVLAMAAPAHAAHPTLSSATLTGAAEVPGPGDPDGSGFANVASIPSQGKICVALFVGGIEPATAAHIHEGAADEAGPVVVTLPAPTSGGAGGCVDVDPALAGDISADPGDYYVNVHNSTYPAGAVRGQLG